jgi:drug/metabolite transporter (DMT)-like permease
MLMCRAGISSLVGFVALCIVVGACMSAITTFIFQSDPATYQPRQPTGRLVSRRIAVAAFVMYAGLLAVLCRRLDRPVDIATVVLLVAIGVCLSTLATFIAQAGSPK